MEAFHPRISVVIPVYNGANYLATAIDSALAQSYGNVEVLIVDDGSTDNGATESVARSYGDRVRYHRKPNGGVSSALNAGIALMEGEYFSWLSHDDRYLPEKLERQVGFIAAHPEVEVLATGLEVIDNDGKVTYDYSCEEVHVIRNGRAVMDHWVYGCSLLIHKNVFARVGGFNEHNRTVQDLEMWLKIVHEGTPITMMPDILCQWRHHEQSDSYKQRSAHFREVDAFLRRAAQAYPIDFFAAGSAELSRAELQATYSWLAEQALRRGATAQAQVFRRSALLAYPNVFGMPFWRILRRGLSTFRHSMRLRQELMAFKSDGS
jgi:glycosyltransferase involved in cell wall biosynthesis